MLGVGVVIIGLCKVKVRAHVGMFTISFFSNDLYFGFIRPSVIQQYCVVGQIVVANEPLRVLISRITYFPYVCFYERTAMT